MDLYVNLLVLLKFLIVSILIKSNSASCTYEKRYDETDAAGQQIIGKTQTVCCEGYVQIQAEFNEVICYPECKNCLQGYCVTPINKLSSSFNEMLTGAGISGNETDSNNSAVGPNYISLYTSMIVSTLFFIIRMILMIVTIVLIIKIQKIQHFRIHTDLPIENVLAVITNQPKMPESPIVRDLPPIPPDEEGLYDDLVLLKSTRVQSDGYMPMTNPQQSTYTEILYK